MRRGCAALGSKQGQMPLVEPGRLCPVFIFLLLPEPFICSIDSWNKEKENFK